jgi:DNA helicase-2/ATP-dependent DNA helicase PcrA
VNDSNVFAMQVAELLERTSMATMPTDVDTQTEIHSACEQLLELGQPGETISQLMSRIRDTQDPSPVQAGVHVLNAHVGKGQQFDWVIVMGLEEGHVPSAYSTTKEQVLEELRVLLVMLSRARKGLFLTYAGETRNKYGRIFRQGPTRWWGVMAAACKPIPENIRRIMQQQ